MSNKTSANAARLERENFRKRLHEALKRAGHSTSPTKLAKAFNALSPDNGVTTHAVRKWILGESIPTQDKLRVLAQMLDMSVAQLRFGEEPDTLASTILADIEALSEPMQGMAHEIIQVLLRYSRIA